MIVAVGIIIGLILGLTGAGGSIFAVPLLHLLPGVSINDAMGISLGAVGSAAAIGVLLRIKRNNIDWKAGAVLSLWGMASAPLGRHISTLLPDHVLLISFSLLATYLAHRMWRQANNHTTQHVRASTDTGNSPSPKNGRRYRRGIVQLSGAGLLCGFVSGLLGVGGGFIIVPVLTLFIGVRIHQAVGTSLLAISLISATGFTYHITEISMLPADLLALAILGSIAGILLGTLVEKRLAGPQLHRVFAVSVVALMITTLTQTYI